MLHPDFVQRYAILAADEAAAEGKKVSDVDDY